MSIVAVIGSRHGSGGGSGGGGGTPAAPYLASIVVSGATNVVATYTTSAYTAVGKDQFGATFSFTPIFASGSTGVATVNSSTGVATGVSGGTSGISAHATNSLGQVITSNTLTLTVAARQVMTVTLAGGASSVIATHSTAAFTATAKDQNSGTMTGQTFVFSSSVTASATINSSTGVATGVAAGSTNIKATCAGVDSNLIGLTVAAQVATSPIVVTPSSFSLSIGNTRSLTAVVSDQGSPANVISGASVSWSSGTPANATVNSSTGVVTGVANGSSTITATSGSATGTSAATVAAASGFMGSNGAVPVESEDPDLYTVETSSSPNATWRARLSSNIPVLSNTTLKGTGGAGCFYSDYSGGGFVDLILIQGGTGPTSGNVFEATFFGANAGDQTPNPQFIHYIPSAKYPKRAWFGRQIWHQIGWTNQGDADSAAGITWNNSQSTGMKTGPWTNSPYDQGGRDGSDMVGTQYDAEGGCKYGSTLYGLVDSWMGTVQNEWTDGNWYDELWLIEYITGSDGNPWYVQTCWRKLTTAANSTYVRLGPKLTAPLTGAPTPGGQERMGSWQWTCKNYNQSRKTNIIRRHAKGGWWDADNPNNDGSDDPFGVLALDTAHAPTAPVSTTFVSKAGNAVTFDVKLTGDYPSKDPSYAKKLRPVIDGVTQTGVDVTVPYEQSESWCERAPTNTGPTAQVIRVTITVSNGTHTVGFKAVNGAGTLVSATSSTASVTVP